MSAKITVNIEGLHGTRERVASELRRLAVEVASGASFASTTPNGNGGTCQATVGMDDAWFPNACEACVRRHGKGNT